jgi:hypothetical protein
MSNVPKTTKTLLLPYDQSYVKHAVNACKDRQGNPYITYGRCGDRSREYLFRGITGQSPLDYVTMREFYEAVGNDEFPIMLGSAGVRVEQLKQALRVLGAKIDEENFGSQTKEALKQFGYTEGWVINEPKFNDIVLRAYEFGGKKKIELTEPQLRALYEKEVPSWKRDKKTFEKWLKKEQRDGKFIEKIKEDGKKVFDVLAGWLSIKAAGLGTGGVPNAPQPEDTTGGWFKSSKGEIPVGYYYVGGAVVLGLGIWGISALIKNRQQVVYVQNPIMK